MSDGWTLTGRRLAKTPEPLAQAPAGPARAGPCSQGCRTSARPRRRAARRRTPDTRPASARSAPCHGHRSTCRRSTARRIRTCDRAPSRRPRALARPLPRLPGRCRRPASSTIFARTYVSSLCSGITNSGRGSQTADRARVWPQSRAAANYQDAIVSPYSIASASARQLASMMFALAPTVVHRSVPLCVSIRTRVTALVPSVPFRMRTL